MKNLDVLASLEAKSRTTTVEALAKRGRTNVRVIRAADVALMIQESVERAIEISGLVSPEAIEEVKNQANVEFEALKSERAAEAKRVDDLETRSIELEEAVTEKDAELEKLQQELGEARSRLSTALAQVSEVDTGEIEELREENERLTTLKSALENELDGLRQQRSEFESQSEDLRIKTMALEELQDAQRMELARLEQSEQERQNSDTRLAEAEANAQALQDRVSELEGHVETLESQIAAAHAQAAAQASAPAAAAPTQDPTQALLMMRLMDEIQNLKQGGTPAETQPVAAAAPTAPTADTSSLEDKLAKIVGSLDQKIEKMGKKMGVSTTVESEVDFNSLVSRAVDDSDNLESNVENLDVEKRAGTGIAANLARIKKLKGGG